jgi:hypothetical protein
MPPATKVPPDRKIVFTSQKSYRPSSAAVLCVVLLLCGAAIQTLHFHDSEQLPGSAKGSSSHCAACVLGHAPSIGAAPLTLVQGDFSEIAYVSQLQSDVTSRSRGAARIRPPPSI